MGFSLNIKSFFGRLMLSHLIVILISLLVIGFMFGYLVQNYYHGVKEWEAITNGHRIARLVRENLRDGSINTSNVSNMQDKINTIARSSGMEIALMNDEGELIANSETTTNNFKLNLEQEDIEQVLAGNSITRKMMGPEYKNLLMLVPMLEEKEGGGNVEAGPKNPEEDRVVGSIVIAASLGGIAQTANSITRFILYSLVVALIASAFLSVSFTRWVTAPLNELKDSAYRIARGEFQEVKVPENSSEELKHLSKTFNYAVKQIKETLSKKKRLEKVRKEFVEDISHEFRAPLTSVKGFLELISEQNLSQEDIDRYVDIMHKDTQYLEHLLSDLLDLAQLSADNIELEREPVEPEALIKRAIESLELKMKEKNLTFRQKLEDDLPVIEVDVNRIHQVFVNLLKNAIAYSPPGKTITIAAKSTEPETEGSVCFEIQDEGPGIPPAEQTKVWERFYKLDGARTRKENEGSGLGLAIVKNIVERHGGEVYLESEPKEGSIFGFVV